MNFWNNPENNSLKVIILVLVIAGAGYFAFQYMQNDSLGGSGRVINTNVAQSSGFTFKTEFNGPMCTVTVCSTGAGAPCVALLGKDNKGGSCKLDEQQSTPEAQGLLPIVIAQPTAQTN